MGQYERYSSVRYLHRRERGNVMKDVIVDRHFKYISNMQLSIFMLGCSIMSKQSVLYSTDIDY